MNIRFTIEEENIICIYWQNNRKQTVQNILAAMPYMEGDMRRLAGRVIVKLQAMTDSDFSETDFDFTDEE